MNRKRKVHGRRSLSPINIEQSLTYVNWTRKNCSLPVTFVINDFDELNRLPEFKLFARKFDIKLDMEILDKLDISVI